jgi:hypothetical protein
MWCGRPSVVTNVSGDDELSINQETSFVATAPTVGSLGQTFESAWEGRMKWLTMGLMARSRVEQKTPKDPVANFCQHLLASVSTPAAQKAN